MAARLSALLLERVAQGHLIGKIVEGESSFLDR
jgi:hypothetical protein